MRRSPFSLALAGAAIALASAQTGAAASTPKTKTHRATCDELRGTTFQRNDRWRVFGGLVDTFNSDLIACRRSSRPVTRLLKLGAWANTPRLSGDLLQVENEGRYDNCAGYFIDLTARRFTNSHDCASPGRNDLLLPSGAVVRFSTPSSAPPAPAHSAETGPVGDIVLEDGNGPTPIATGASDVAGFPATATSPEGFYFTASDGTLQRRTTSGRVDTAGWTPLSRSHGGFDDGRQVRTRARVKTVPGRTTTYLGPWEIRRERATRGRPESLTLRYPNEETIGSKEKDADLLARLAPGSAGELRAINGTFVGRFANDPSALRLYVPSYDKPGRSLFTLPYPTDPAAAPIAAGQAIVFPTATGVDLLQRRYYETAPALIPIPLPPGAHDLVATNQPGLGSDSAERRLLYTDATGRAASVNYTLPGA